MNTKYPKLRLTAAFAEKIKLVPLQAWWSEDDEPVYRFDEYNGSNLPYSICLRYGIMELDQ